LIIQVGLTEFEKPITHPSMMCSLGSQYHDRVYLVTPVPKSLIMIVFNDIQHTGLYTIKHAIFKTVEIFVNDFCRVKAMPKVEVPLYHNEHGMTVTIYWF